MFHTMFDQSTSSDFSSPFLCDFDPMIQDNTYLVENFFQNEAIPNEFQAKAPSLDQVKSTIKDLVVRYKSDWNRVVKAYEKIFHQAIDKNTAKSLYRDNANSELRGKKYSAQDDSNLVEAIALHGFDWNKISHSFPGRCPLSLRNRYYNLLKYNKLDEKDEKKLRNGFDIDMLKVPIRFLNLQEEPEFLKVISSLMEEKKEFI